MQSCLCTLRAECPGKKYLWALRKAACASPVCRQEITLELPGKGQNPDVPSGSANEPWRLMRLVQGALHPGSGICTAKRWERTIPSCPHGVREGSYLVGQISSWGQRACFSEITNYVLIYRSFTTTLVARCTMFLVPKQETETSPYSFPSTWAPQAEIWCCRQTCKWEKSAGISGQVWKQFTSLALCLRNSKMSCEGL